MSDRARMKTSNRTLSYTLPKGLNHLWVYLQISDGLKMLIEQKHARRSPPSIRRSTPTPSQRSDVAVESPPLQSDEGESTPPYLSIAENSPKSSKRFSTSPVSPPPITTSVPPARDWSATPRAQTRSEAEADLLEHERPKNATRSRSLEGKRYRSCFGCMCLSGGNRHP